MEDLLFSLYELKLLLEFSIWIWLMVVAFWLGYTVIPFILRMAFKLVQKIKKEKSDEKESSK